MKIVLIYGPPAVGKLTVSKELSKITNFMILHNHLSIDPLKALVGDPHGSKHELEFWRTNMSIKFEMIKLASITNNNLIYTFCYAHGQSNTSHNRFMRFVEKLNIKPLFVRLDCSDNSLISRVVSPSRKMYHKLKNKAELKKSLKKYDYRADIPKSNTFFVDNTHLTPKKVALMIKKHYKL